MSKENTALLVNTVSNLPSKQVSTGGGTGASSNGRLPVGLINKDGSKVTNNVNNSEHESISGKHGQIRSLGVSRDGSTGVGSHFVESHTVGVTINGFTLGGVVVDGLVQEFVDGVTGVDLDVDEEDHCNQHSKNNDSVDVTGQESSLKTSRGGVKNHTPGDKERSQSVIHTGQSFDSGSSTQQKHGCDNDVGQKAKYQKGLVGSSSPASIDNLTHGVSRGRNLLEGNGQNTEKQDLNGGTRGIPIAEEGK